MSQADRYRQMNMINITDISELKRMCLKIQNCNIKGRIISLTKDRRMQVTIPDLTQHVTSSSYNSALY